MNDVEVLAAPSTKYLTEAQRLLDFLIYFSKSIRLIAQERDSLPPAAEIVTAVTQTPLISELVFQRFVDNFLSFISDMLAAVFAIRPEMLRSEERISIKEALEYTTREELLAVLTERKVISLSFKGLVELNDDLSKKYQIALLDNPDELERAAILVEKRNLISHNHAVVNRRYLERVKGAPEKLGETLVFSLESIGPDILFLTSVVKKIQSAVFRKFVKPEELGANPLELLDGESV